MVGHTVHPATAAELAKLGGDPDGFVARQLEVAHAEASDLVLTATRELRAVFLGETPGALRRTFTLREFAALASSSDATTLTELVADAGRRRSSVATLDLDVPDPMGRPAEAHAAAAAIAAEAVDQLSPVLLRLAGMPPAN